MTLSHVSVETPPRLQELVRFRTWRGVTRVMFGVVLSVEKKWLVFFRVAKIATRRKHARHRIDLTLVFCLGYIPDSKQVVAILIAQLCVEDRLAWFRCIHVAKLGSSQSPQDRLAPSNI